MNNATLVILGLGLAGLGIVGIAAKTLYLAKHKVIAHGGRRAISSTFAVFVLLVGVLLAGLSLSYVLTKQWAAIPHFLLLAGLCWVSIYLQLKPAKKLVASVAQPASARVEPTADPVTEATPAVAPASAEQPASAASAVAASAVAATAVAATAATASSSGVDEASLPDAPEPERVSAVTDDVLDSWVPEEDEAASPVAQSTDAKPAVASEVVDASPVPELDPQSVLEMPAPADIEDLAAVSPAVPAPVASSLDDEALDVLDLNGVTKVSDAPVSVNAEQRVDVVEPASDNEVARPVVASTSDTSVAVA
jgi:hypothetical protein